MGRPRDPHVVAIAGDVRPHVAQPPQHEENESLSSLNKSTSDALTELSSLMHEAMAANANMVASYLAEARKSELNEERRAEDAAKFERDCAASTKFISSTTRSVTRSDKEDISDFRGALPDDSPKIEHEPLSLSKIEGGRNLYMTQDEIEEKLNSIESVPTGRFSMRRSEERGILNQESQITTTIAKAVSLFEFDSREYDSIPSLDDCRSSKLKGFSFRARDEAEYLERYEISEEDLRQIDQKERDREARAAKVLAWENRNKKGTLKSSHPSPKTKPEREKLRQKIASRVTSSKEFVSDVAKRYLFRLRRKRPNRGVKKQKYIYGSTDDSIERTTNRRGTKVNHWGSDEDLVHDFGVRVPALQISQQFSPIPKPAETSGKRPRRGGEAGATSDWKFPVDRAGSGGEIAFDELDKQATSEGALSSKGAGRKISFFDVGGLLDDYEEPIAEIDHEPLRATTASADVDIAGDGASEDATSSYPLFCGIRTSSKLTAPQLLSIFISKGTLNAIETAVNEQFDLAATGQFEWILDLREAGFSNREIVRSLIESDQSSPWNIPSSDIRRAEFNEFMDPQLVPAKLLPSTNFHQPQCVHKGPNHKFSPSESAHSDYQLHFDFSKIEAIRREVAELCGLAGVDPPVAKRVTKGHTIFNGTSVRIDYGPWQTDGGVVYLVKIISRICNAMSVLQVGGLCCDSITILAKLESEKVHMSHVSHHEIQIYIYALDILMQFSSGLRSAKGRKSGGGIIDDELDRCAHVALKIMQSWMPSELKRETISFAYGGTATYNLHLCALFCQVLAINLISYAQGHTGEFHPHYLKDSLKSIRLEGLANQQYPKLVAEFSYQKLACMGDLVGGEVLVLQMSFQSTEVQSIEMRKGSIGSESNPSTFVGSIQDIIDSWGPGVLISDSDLQAPYGEKIKSVLIGGGTIAALSPGKGKSLSAPLYHWSRSFETLETDGTFDIGEELTIGAIKTQPSCLLNSDMCRRASQPYLTTLGTDNDYWALAQRQAMLQGGQYVGLQVGNVYNKMKGRSLKATMLDAWRMMPDFRMLLQPWGLQVSLCTGVARRVPLKTLIGEPMFAYIDGLSLDGWKDIKSDVRLAFNGTIDYISWTAGLVGAKRLCLIKVVTFFLEILNDTGVDREGKQLRMLWPHESSLCYAISLQCSKSNLWARVLKDSPSCATFAAVTSTCLEGPGHNCKRNTAPTWTGQGALLSTAVSRVLVPGALGGAGTAQWELKNGQQCWIEKAGGDIWVYTTKAPNSDTQLRVKINRFPKGLSIFRDWQVLRERQDATFEAEEVVVFGTMA